MLSCLSCFSCYCCCSVEKSETAVSFYYILRMHIDTPAAPRVLKVFNNVVQRAARACSRVDFHDWPRRNSKLDWFCRARFRRVLLNPAAATEAANSNNTTTTAPTTPRESPNIINATPEPAKGEKMLLKVRGSLLSQSLCLGCLALSSWSC